MPTMPTLSAKDLRSQKIRDLYAIATSAKNSAKRANLKARELVQETPLQAAGGTLAGAFLSPLPDTFLPKIGPVYPSTVAGVIVTGIGVSEKSTMLASLGAGMATAQARELGVMTFSTIYNAIFGAK